MSQEETVPKKYGLERLRKGVLDSRELHRHPYVFPDEQRRCLMSVMDRDYMRRNTSHSNKPAASGRQNPRLVGISRSEKISLVIGAVVIAGLLVLALA